MNSILLRGRAQKIRQCANASGVAIIIAASLGFVASAAAQEAAVEEVVVTGSRIVRDGYQAPTPTTVLGIEEIQKAAPVNIANFVNDLPQLSATSTPRTGTTGTSGGTNGQNTLNLRSLGINRTLVLFNGQRVAASSIAGAADINNLPTALIQRVEVVTGGASAAYGSDAVAGVVNFVLDEKFRGLKGSASTGITERSDGRTYNGEIAFGTPWADGRGHVLGSVELARSQGIDGIDVSKRQWFRSCNIITLASTARPQRVVGCDSNLRTVAKGGVITSTALANIQFGDGGTPATFVRGTPSDTNFMIGGNKWFEGNVAALEGAQRRANLWSKASYNLTDTITFGLEGSYGQSSTNNRAAYQRYPGSGSTALTMRADNPYLPASVAAQAAAAGITTFLYGYSSYDLKPPVNYATRTTSRVVASLNGELPNDWKWDAYYQHGETETNVELRNTTNVSRFALAIDATRNSAGQIVCRSTLTNPTNGCVPLNIFGYNVASPEAIAYVKGVGTQDLVLKQDVAAATVTGEPFSTWAGPVSVAAGGEYRKESVSGTSDAISQANGFFTGNFKPTKGEFDVREAFGEVVVPLANGAPLAQSLEFNGAMRYTDYSLAGSVTTWKAGLSWTPIEDLRLRAVRSRDIRAPNLGELFQAGATARQDVIDTSQPSRPSVSIQRVTSGNINLQPEEADTTSLGVVYRPSWLPQFSASVDYYKIDIAGAVGTVGNQQIVDRCVAGETALCALIVRNGAGQITQIFGFPINVAQQVTSGIDYEASWRQSLNDYGALSLRLLATNIREFYTINGALKTNTLGENSGSTPKWRWLASATYDYERFSSTLTARGFSDGVYDNTWTSGVDIDNNEIPGAYYLQLSASYRLLGESTGSRTVAFMNIENLLDRDPELVAGTGINAVHSNSTLYDLVGRSYRIGVRFQY